MESRGFANFFPLVANEMGVEFGLTSMVTMPSSQSIFWGEMGTGEICFQSKRDALISSHTAIEESVPRVRRADYFTEPSAADLISRESKQAGYCSRVHNFVVGRVGYGYVRFFGETDVRWLELENIVEFNNCEIRVYRDESSKPPVGKGLNKPAEVSLIIEEASLLKGEELDEYRERLKRTNERQGSQFISFDPWNCEWKFVVQHFSRYGLDDEDEDEEEENNMEPSADILMLEQPRPSEGAEEQITAAEKQEENAEDRMALDEIQAASHRSVLSHSLPEHLRLDPVKMQQMRMLFFPTDEEEEEAEDIAMPGTRDRASRVFRNAMQKTPAKETARQSGSQGTAQRGVSAKPKPKPSPHRTWQQSPYSGTQYLLEYNKDSSPLILMTQQHRGELAPSKRTKIAGFSLDVKTETPISAHSGNVVDAALFMGRSFRVGWGPNGLLVHSGMSVGQTVDVNGLSSLIHIQKVAFDKTVRNEQDEVNDDLIDLQFVSPLKHHISMSRVLADSEHSPHDLKLREVVCSRSELPDVCQGYVELIEKQLNVPGLSRSKRIISMHQVMVWHLLSVLFLQRDAKLSIPIENDEEFDGMTDVTEGSTKIDPEAEPLIRRAEFSGWLQESVDHRVQEEVRCLKEGSDLKHIFSLLTGRQLDEAVQLTAYRGDVRMACLISQAGGSMINRMDMAAQLEAWSTEGLDYSFIEEDRLKLYKLLGGDIQGALTGMEIDWKRYLGLLMWYHLTPDTALPTIISNFQQLVDQGVAPPPVPVYIDEGPLEEASNLNVEGRYDLTYYLMLLHASDGKNYVNLSKMFTSFSSTYDALDYHMTWHQQSILQAIGLLDSKELHVLYMSFVSQLLCVGECHWAIYVVLHMPPTPDYPMLHEKVIKEILCQYCETWSSVETQKQFIEELGIPSEWMHEALAIHCQYYGNSTRALGHLLKSLQWQRAHSLFMTSVASSLFHSSQHSEVWRLSSIMEEHKSEIADWDLGAGIYIDFYTLRNVFQDNQLMEKLDSLEKKNAACQNFYVHLNQSLCLWRSKFPLNARVTFSKMADEVASLLTSENKKDTHTRSLQMSCFDTITDAPVPEDLRLCRLQDAVSVFTSWLSEVTS